MGGDGDEKKSELTQMLELLEKQQSSNQLGQIHEKVNTVINTQTSHGEKLTAVSDRVEKVEKALNGGVCHGTEAKCELRNESSKDEAVNTAAQMIGTYKTEIKERRQEDFKYVKILIGVFSTLILGIFLFMLKFNFTLAAAVEKVSNGGG